MNINLNSGNYAAGVRFDGNEQYDSIKTVRCLFVDEDGRMFVGTNDNGLSIIINEEITNVLTEKNGLPSDSVRCIPRGAKGRSRCGCACR